MSIRQKLPTRNNRFLLGIAAAALLLLTVLWRWHASRHQPPPEPEIITPAAETPAPAQAAAKPDAVLDLFNPSEVTLSQQISETALKGRLEEVMTTSFILKRCGLLSDADYNDTYRALMIYAQKMQPSLSAAQLQESFAALVAAASASYGLIYARLSCDTPQLATSAAQLYDWREAILNPPPR